MKMVLGMSFLTLGNADVQFAKKKLTWRTYITKNALLTIYQVEIIDQKKFAKAALDENVRAFAVYVSSLGSRISIYLTKKAQLALLLTKKVTVLIKYSDFANVFLENLANMFTERIKADEHTIEL